MQPHMYFQSTPQPPRPLGPYEWVATPPIQLILNAICELLVVGGSAAPGVRQLAEIAGVSRGMVSDNLRQLAIDGWIAYDGRYITLLRHPDEAHDQSDVHPDEVIDQSDVRSDQAIDQSDVHSAATMPALAPRRVLVPDVALSESARPTDRSRPSDSPPPYNPPMEYIHVAATAAAATQRNSIGGSGGPSQNDQPADHPAAAVMRQYGADGKIVNKALMARPDYTPDQVHALWAWQEQRRAQNPNLGPGIFFTSLAAGQLAPTARSAAVDWAAYKRKEAAALAAPADEPPPTDLGAATEQARRLAPDATPDELAVMAADLVEGLSEQAVLDWLAERRARQATLDALERQRRQVRR